MSDNENKSYKNLGFLSDKTKQFRIFSDEPKDAKTDQDLAEVLEVFQPLSKYKAACNIKRGQAVSIATAKQLKDEYENTEDTYVVLSDPKLHETTLGLALNTVEAGQVVQIQSFGSIKIEKEDKLPFVTSYEDDVGKTVWVSGKEGEQGNLTTNNNDVYYNPDSNILQIGIIADVNKKDSVITDVIIELNIEGDQRGPIDSTQFELPLAEPFISVDEPIVFALGHEGPQESVVFIKENTNLEYTEAETKDIKDGSALIVHHNLKTLMFKFGDNSKFSFKDLNVLRYYKSQTEDEIVEISVEYKNLKDFTSFVASEMNKAFIGEEFKCDELYKATGHNSIRIRSKDPVSTVDYYFTDAMILPRHPFHGSYVEKFGCKESNYGKAVLADIRNPERQNVIGVFNSKNFGVTYGPNSNEYTKAIFMKNGRWTSSKANDIFKISEEELKNIGSYAGSYLYLGTSGNVTRTPYNIFNRQVKIGSVLNDFSFLMDSENLNVKPSAVMPVGGITLCPITDDGVPVADEGYLVCDGTTQIEISRFPELFDYLSQYYNEQDLNVDTVSVLNEIEGDFKVFTVPVIKTVSDRYAQIKAFSNSEYINTKQTFFERKFGTFEGAEINPIDISELCNSYAVYTSGNLLEQFTLRLFVELPKYDEEGGKEWIEIHEGIQSENGVNTFGFNWVLDKIENESGAPIFLLRTDTSRSSDGIKVLTNKSSISQSVEGLQYYVFIAQTRYFDERIDMSRYWLAYHSDAVIVNYEPTERPVTGKAVADFVKHIIDTIEEDEIQKDSDLYGYHRIPGQGWKRNDTPSERNFYCNHTVDGSFTFVLKRDDKDRVTEKIVIGEKEGLGDIYHITYEYDGDEITTHEEKMDNFARKAWVEEKIEEAKADTLAEAKKTATAIADSMDIARENDHLILEDGEIKKLVTTEVDGKKVSGKAEDLGEKIRAKIDGDDIEITNSEIKSSHTATENNKKSTLTLTKSYKDGNNTRIAALTLEADRQTRRTLSATKVSVTNEDTTVESDLIDNGDGNYSTAIDLKLPLDVSDPSVLFSKNEGHETYSLDLINLLKNLKGSVNGKSLSSKDGILYVESKTSDSNTSENLKMEICLNSDKSKVVFGNHEYEQLPNYFIRNKTFKSLSVVYEDENKRHLYHLYNYRKDHYSDGDEMDCIHVDYYDGNKDSSTFELEKSGECRARVSKVDTNGDISIIFKFDGDTFKYHLYKNVANKMENVELYKIEGSAEKSISEVTLYEAPDKQFPVAETKKVFTLDGKISSTSFTEKDENDDIVFTALVNGNTYYTNFNGNECTKITYTQNDDDTNDEYETEACTVITKNDNIFEKNWIFSIDGKTVTNLDGQNKVNIGEDVFELKEVTLTKNVITKDQRVTTTYDDKNYYVLKAKNVTLYTISSNSGTNRIMAESGSGLIESVLVGESFTSGGNTYYSIGYSDKYVREVDISFKTEPVTRKTAYSFNSTTKDEDLYEKQDVISFENSVEYNICEVVDRSKDNENARGYSVETKNVRTFWNESCTFEVELLENEGTFQINGIEGTSPNSFVGKKITSAEVKCVDIINFSRVSNDEIGYLNHESRYNSSSSDIEYEVKFIPDTISTDALEIYSYIYHDSVAKFHDGNNNSIPVIASGFEQSSKAEYKHIYEEDSNPYDGGDKLFETEDDGKNLFKGSALQAVYETPASRFKYKNASNGDKDQVGIIVDKLNFITKEGIDSVTDNGEIKNNPRQIFDVLPENYLETVKAEGLNNFAYNEDEIKSIKEYLSLETNRAENAENVTTVVGIHNKALKETYIRLLRNEVALNGWDSDTIPGAKRNNFSDEDSISNSPTTLGLNRLVRALCREVFYNEDPQNKEIKTTTTENDTKVNITRIDRIDGDVNGSDYQDQSKNHLDNDSAFDFGKTYPEISEYTKTKTVTTKNDDGTTAETTEKVPAGEYYLKDLKDGSSDTDTFENKGNKSGIKSKPYQEYLNGDNEVFTKVYKERGNENFDGLKDAVARISSKLNKVTKDIYGYDNVLDSPRTLDILQLYSGAAFEELFFSSPDFDAKNGRDKPTTKYYSRLDILDDILYPNIKVNRMLTGTATKDRPLYGVKDYYKSLNERISDNGTESTVSLINEKNSKDDYDALNIIDFITYSLGDAIVITKNERDTSRSAHNIGERLDSLEEFAHLISNIVLKGDSLDTTNVSSYSWAKLFEQYKQTKDSASTDSDNKKPKYYTDLYSSSGKLNTIQDYLEKMVEFTGVRFDNDRFGNTSALAKIRYKENQTTLDGSKYNLTTDDYLNIFNELVKANKNADLAERIITSKDIYTVLMMLTYYNSLNYHLLRRDRTALGSFVLDDENFDYSKFGLTGNEVSSVSGMKPIIEEDEADEEKLPINKIIGSSSYTVYDVGTVMAAAIDKIYGEMAKLQISASEKDLKDYIEEID